MLKTTGFPESPPVALTVQVGPPSWGLLGDEMKVML
jgi:hypothetical protein